MFLRMNSKHHRELTVAAYNEHKDTVVNCMNRDLPIYTVEIREITIISKSTVYFWSGKLRLRYYWFASASLANPYCQSTWICVCLFVCLSGNLRSNISETKGARGSVTMGSL